MFKKFLCVLAACVLGLCALCACGGGNGNEELLEGEFYSLGEAYEAGWLTQEDLKSIAYYVHGGRAHNEEIMSEDYTPIPKTPATLDAVTENSIKQTYWNDYFGESNSGESDLSEIGLIYYGSYNGCIAVMVGYGDRVSHAIWEVTVGGVKFFNSVYIKMQIWKAEELGGGEQGDNEYTASGSFCTLEEAYEQGFLNRADIMSISYYLTGAVYEVAAEVENKYDEEQWTKIDFVPDKDLSELDASVEEDIITSYFKNYIKQFQNSEGELRYGKDILFLSRYLGEYHGHYVVIVDSDQWLYPAVDRVVYTDGIIWLQTGARIEVFTYA